MTHKQKVLRLLGDRQPHTHHELYALGCVAHSRIADLRKDGHTIRQWRDGDHYLYQLVGETLGEAAVSDAGLEADASVSAAAASPSVPPTHAPHQGFPLLPPGDTSEPSAGCRDGRGTLSLFSTAPSTYQEPEAA